MKASNRTIGYHIPILMAASLLALLFFLGFWLFQSYQQEKRQLKRDVDHLMMRSARTVESNLLSLFDTLNQERSMRAIFRLQNKVIDEADSATLLTIPTQRMKFRIRGKERRDFQVAATGRRLKMPVSIGLFASLTSQEDSLTQSALVDTVIQLLQESFDSERNHGVFPTKTQILFEHTDSLPVYQGIASNPFFDFTTNLEARVTTNDYTGYLLKALLPEILISFLLILLTTYTFYILYKNLKNEKQLSKERTDLIANISHELNTPITTVGIALETAESDTDSNNLKRYIGLAREQNERLATLVSNILAGLNRSQQQMQLKRLNLVEVTKNTIEKLHLLAEKMNGELIYYSEQTEAIAWVDLSIFQSILTNIIENALKYAGPEPRIEIHINADQEAVVVAIQDNGPGIKKEYQKKIFESFYRIPTGNVHNIKGYGLGLSYVKNMMKQLNGNVEVASDGIHGTRITLRLPRAYEG